MKANIVCFVGLALLGACSSSNSPNSPPIDSGGPVLDASSAADTSTPTGDASLEASTSTPTGDASLEAGSANASGSSSSEKGVEGGSSDSGGGIVDAGSDSSGTPPSDPNAIQCPVSDAGHRVCEIPGTVDWELNTYSDLAPMTHVLLTPVEACLYGTLSPAGSGTYGAGIQFLFVGLGVVDAGGSLGNYLGRYTGAIEIKVSNIPAFGALVVLSNGSVGWCTPLTAATSTIPLDQFVSSIQCNANPSDSGVGDNFVSSLSIQAVAGPTEETIDLCVEQITFLPAGDE